MVGPPITAPGYDGWVWSSGCLLARHGVGAERLWYGDRNWGRYRRGDSDAGLAGATDGFPSRAYGLGTTNSPPLPQLEELQRMNWSHLRRVLDFGAARLLNGLERLRTGDQWASYLRVERLRGIARDDGDLPPTRAEVDALVAMLERYNETAEQPSYASISGLWGFQSTHRALAEFLENPAARYRRQVALNANDLDRALERFQTGAGWQHHLSLPAVLFVDPADAAAARHPPDPELMRKALAKFDDVAKNPAYRVIANLPEFQATHASLERYLGRQRGDADAVAEAAATAPPDPSLNEPAPVEVKPQADPFRAESEQSQPGEEKPPAPQGARPAPRQVEELVAPMSDAVPKSDSAPRKKPAVREKS